MEGQWITECLGTCWQAAVRFLPLVNTVHTRYLRGIGVLWYWGGWWYKYEILIGKGCHSDCLNDTEWVNGCHTDYQKYQVPGEIEVSFDINTDSWKYMGAYSALWLLMPWCYKAPGDQYPWWWANIHCMGPLSDTNIIFIVSNIRKKYIYIL